MSSGKPPLLRVHYRDPDDGWEGLLVIDSLVEGRAAGGVRISRTTDVTEITRLARAMTLKMQSLDLPLGGAKAGIRYSPDAPDRTDALVRFFDHVRPICETMYGFGPDMNTAPAQLDEVASRIGLRSRHTALAGKDERRQAAIERYNTVLREQFGPVTVNEARSGVGVAASVERASAVLGLSDKPLRVAVQGFGQVGGSTAWGLAQQGHRIVALGDDTGCYSNPTGFDIESLLNARGADKRIPARALPAATETAPPEGILKADADVLVLAATADVITTDNASSVRASLVVEGGNLAVTEQAALLLHSRNVPVIPDFLASGGAITVVAGVICLDWATQDVPAFLDRVARHVGDAVERAVRRARETSLPVREAALLNANVQIETRL